MGKLSLGAYPSGVQRGNVGLPPKEPPDEACPMPRVLRHFLLLALLAISASLIATEPIVRPKVLATAKPSGRVVRQILVANPKSPRVLLIGDSILEGYHAKAAELLRGKVNLDVWVTWKHIGCEDLPADIKAIFGKHSYDVILFNDIGLHAWVPGRIPKGQYDPLLRAHLANLRKFAPKPSSSSRLRRP